MTQAVAIVSGGLDSTVLAYLLAQQYDRLTLLSFDYGQRHRREVEDAARTAVRLNADWFLLDLSIMGRLLGQNALTGAAAVPDGHYAAETMRVTVVPNRNAIMLAIAYAVAVDQGAAVVATAVHGGDHFIYPDCRPAFMQAFAAMEAQSLDGLHLPTLITPFITQTKAAIVALGARLGVPFADTWSCYKGGAVQCGTCGTCTERREAFALAGVVDPTEYATTENEQHVHD